MMTLIRVTSHCDSCLWATLSLSLLYKTIIFEFDILFTYRHRAWLIWLVTVLQVLPLYIILIVFPTIYRIITACIWLITQSSLYISLFSSGVNVDGLQLVRPECNFNKKYFLKVHDRRPSSSLQSRVLSEMYFQFLPNVWWTLLTLTISHVQ